MEVRRRFLQFDSILGTKFLPHRLFDRLSRQSRSTALQQNGLKIHCIASVVE
jgi:hypothetical protein